MDLILILRDLFLYFGSYMRITEHILVLRILYLCYIIYSRLSNLILVLRSISLYFGSYTELILVFRIRKYLLVLQNILLVQKYL